MNSQPATLLNRFSPACPPLFRAGGSVLRHLKSGAVSRTASLLAVAFLLSPFTAMAADPPAPFRHVVIFGFKEGTPAAKIDEIAAAFKELKGKIPSVKSFEWGLNVSPENMNPELTHVFTLTFDNKESLEKTYLHNPEHLKFVALVKPHIAKAVVVDYVAK
ncbi:MAG: Dabb family protein [Verrucomicrobiota bacterium]